MVRRAKQFSDWFDAKFGWFFTNGMKAQHKMIAPFLCEVDDTEKK